VWKRLEQELDKHDLSLHSLEGDGWSAPATSQLEFQVLTAASALGNGADKKSITKIVENWTGGDMMANVYGALCRLEKRGLIGVRRTQPHWPPSAEAVIRFDLTRDGDRALCRAKAEGKQLMPAQAVAIKGEIVS